MLPDIPFSETPHDPNMGPVPEVSAIDYHKTMFEGRLFKLLGDVTRENKLTLLEINQVFQKVSGIIADDLDETLSKHYTSRQ